MGLAETAELVVNLNMKGNFAQGAKQAQGVVGGLQTSYGKLSRTLETPTMRGFMQGAGLPMLGFGAGQGALLAGMAVKEVVDYIGTGIEALRRIEVINTQTEAAIKSTGAAANVTADEVEDLAGSIEKLTATEAETVQEGANLLLTFTSIRNEVGAGNDIFDQATLAITDMSRALGQDMKSSAIQVGKALQDPILGMTALRRVGVSFTEQQVEQVKSLMASNRQLDAQKLILAELNRQFGGSGAAFAQTDTGKLDLLNHKLGELQEALAGAVLPAFQGVVDYILNDALPAFDTVVGHLQNLEKGMVDLRDTVNETVGRDIENDFFNMARGTLVFPLISDAAGNMGFAFEDVARFMNGGEEAFKSYTGEAERGLNIMATLPRVLDDVESSATSSANRLGAAGDAMRESFGSLARGAARARRQSELLADALDHVANTSMTDVKSAAKSTQEAIREALKSDTWAALGKERERLERQRSKFAKQEEFDAVAIVDARLAEIAQQVDMRRRNSLYYRDLFGKLDTTKQKTKDVQDQAAKGATVDVKVKDAPLNSLQAKLDALASGTIVPVTPQVTGPVTGAMLGLGASLAVNVSMSATQTASKTAKVTSRRRYREGNG